MAPPERTDRATRYIPIRSIAAAMRDGDSHPTSLFAVRGGANLCCYIWLVQPAGRMTVAGTRFPHQADIENDGIVVVGRYAGRNLVQSKRFSDSPGDVVISRRCVT